MSKALRDYRARERVSLDSIAEAMRVNKSTVMRWEDHVPAERVLELERITGVSRHDLRPDLYPRSRQKPPL